MECTPVGKQTKTSIFDIFQILQFPGEHHPNPNHPKIDKIANPNRTIFFFPPPPCLQLTYEKLQMCARVRMRARACQLT